MADDTWRVARTVPPAEGPHPPVLADHCAAAVERDGRKVMLVFGGWAPVAQEYTNAVWEFDIKERRWAQLSVPSDAGAGPRGRVGAVAGGAQWGMVVWGGYDGAEVLGDGWHLVPQADGGWLWTPIETPDGEPAPKPRRGAAMAVAPPAPGGSAPQCFLHGGLDGMERLGDLWTLLPTAAGGWRWREVRCDAGTIIPAPRDGHALAVDRDRGQLLLFGGFTTSRCNDLHSMALPQEQADGKLEGRWDRHGQQQQGLLKPRSGHSAFCVGGALVVLFGYDIVERRDVVEAALPSSAAPPDGASADGAAKGLSAPAEAWEPRWQRRTFQGDWPAERRSCHSCVQCPGTGEGTPPEGKLVAFGGWDGQRYLNTVVELEFEKPSDAVQDKKKK